MGVFDVIGTLKSKEFRETIYGFIDRAGRWGVWIALILASGYVLAWSNTDVEWAIAILISEASISLGIQIAVPKLKKPDA